MNKMDRKEIQRRIELKRQLIEIVQEEIRKLEQLRRETGEQSTHGQPARSEEK